jgi:hypothetical protein
MHQIMRNVSDWIIPPSIMTVARILQTKLKDYDVDISLEYACHKVMQYSKRRRLSFKSAKATPYPATVNKPNRPNIWSKLTGLFRREPSLQEYLLSDDQIAHSSEQEYYENIEDEE